MISETRKLGIDILGTVPWGMHVCQLYTTKQDLIDTLVPYFKAGLENNEHCIWITSESLSKKEAEEAMREAVPNFPQYLASQQIEIIPHTDWYLKGGTFNRERVLNAWIDKLQRALASGYDGVRVTGDTAWLKRKDWSKWIGYEKEVNKAISKYHMLAICTYPLHKYGSSEIIDVERNHQFNLIKHNGELALIGSAEYRQAEKELREIEEFSSNLLNYSPSPILVINPDTSIKYVNPALEKLTGFSAEELVGRKAPYPWWTPETLQSTHRDLRKATREGAVGVEELFQKKNGERFWVNISSTPVKEEGKPKYFRASWIDITERKQAESSRRMLLRSAAARPLTELQERYIRLGFEGLDDQKIIELLISLYHHSNESKRLAKECIKNFQNLRGVMSASSVELSRIGIPNMAILWFRILRELPAVILKRKIIEQHVYKSSKEVFDYLYYSMRDLRKEILKVIYLNNRSQIIDTADLFQGTNDIVPINPREIVESAITRSAAGLIFVHNHPTGDPTPSKSDKQLTRDLVFVGNILQINVLDHIIIGENTYFSFADEGLIQKFQDHFFNLKIRGVLASKSLYRYYKDLHKGPRH